MYIAGKVKCIINVQTGLSSENYAKQKKKKECKTFVTRLEVDKGTGGRQAI